MQCKFAAHRDILKIHLSEGASKRADDVEAIVDALALKTEGFSGARLRHLCDEAKRVAVRKVAYTRAVAPTLADAMEALEVELSNVEKGEQNNG